MNAVQAFRQSTLSQGAVPEAVLRKVHASRIENATAVAETDPARLLSHHGEGPTMLTPPKHVVANEKPWHRAAMILTASGMAAREIGLECGVAVETVRNAQKQPWFRARVNELVEKLGTKDTFEMFKAEVQTAQQTVLDIMQNSKSDALKLTAANSVLDRVFGKATQRVEVGAKEVRSADPVAEVARLEQERAAVAKDLGQ